ncbi:MAG: periplasmic heavy metal sensor [Pseudomonadota bacterium]|nr:periplasmic heavy metal sensor [Pseudomonadota bacterium]
MSGSRTTVLIILLTLLGATVGGWGGVRYGLRQVRAAPQLDQLLHEELHLSRAQDRQLAALEARFAAEREHFEGEMQVANRDIAAAITVRHVYDDPAREAIDRLHHAMIGLQQATVQHVIAMRALLSATQVDQFDHTVNQALAVTQP